MNVLSIFTGKPDSQAAPVREMVIETLEALLERARAGQVQAAAVAYSQPDGHTGYVVCGVLDHPCGLIGGLEVAKAVILARSI